MEVLHFEKRLFEAILDRLESYVRKLTAVCSPDNDKRLGIWLDSQDVCLMLNISKRKLQQYRLNETLPFSHIGNKVYHKPEDVNKLIPAGRSAGVMPIGPDGSTTNYNERLMNIINALDEVLKCIYQIGNCNNTLNDERYLTDRQLSQRLNISKRTLQEYRDRRITPFYHLSGKILYRESDLRRLLERNYRVGNK